MGSQDKSFRHHLRRFVAPLALFTLVGTVGCQIDVGGQTLPSPYYLTDDVQYFAPGPEFKLANEAAKMKEASQDEEIR